MISTQIHGRLKLQYLFAQTSEFIFQSNICLNDFSVSSYGVISRKSSVLIIGGYCDGSESSLIAKYTNDNWERVGNLHHTRGRHRVIANQDRFYVVGGSGI